MLRKWARSKNPCSHAGKGGWGRALANRTTSCSLLLAHRPCVGRAIRWAGQQTPAQAQARWLTTLLRSSRPCRCLEQLVLHQSTRVQFHQCPISSSLVIVYPTLSPYPPPVSSSVFPGRIHIPRPRCRVPIETRLHHAIRSLASPSCAAGPRCARQLRGLRASACDTRSARRIEQRHHARRQHRRAPQAPECLRQQPIPVQQRRQSLLPAHRRLLRRPQQRRRLLSTRRRLYRHARYISNRHSHCFYHLALCQRLHNLQLRAADHSCKRRFNGIQRLLPFPLHRDDLHQCSCLLQRLYALPKRCCELHECSDRRRTGRHHQRTQRRCHHHCGAEYRTAKCSQHLLKSESRGVLRAAGRCVQGV